MKIKKKFRLADTFQQVIGSILVSGPFIVTEEVWRIAENLSIIQFLLIFAFNILIGYSALFEADKSRDVDVEQRIGRIPVRLFSLLGVGYFSVMILILLIEPHSTFGINFTGTIYAIGICSIFSIMGAAAADSIL